MSHAFTSALGRLGSRVRVCRAAAALVVVLASMTIWSAEARAQVVFRETFGSTNGQLPTAVSTADGNWTSAACLNGSIITNASGDSPSDDDTGSTHFLFHNTAACAYTANQAVWRTVTPVPVQPNRTYVFSYRVRALNAISPAGLNQLVTPNAGGSITVNNTVTPALAAGVWVQRRVTFTTGVNTTSVDLRIRNTVTTSSGNDFVLDDIILAEPTFPGCDSTMYLAIVPTGSTETQLRRVNTSSNPFTYPNLGSSPVLYNAIAYNPADNYLYGIEAPNVLVRVTNDGTVARLGAISGLPVPTTSGYASGEIGPDGSYYVKINTAVTQLYRVNVATRTATVITLSPAMESADLAWYDGRLYSASNNVLRSITFTGPTTATVANVGPYVGPAGFGAMIGATNGVYGVANEGGFYNFNPTIGAATLLSSSPVTGGLDGAKCASAPVTLPADLSVTKTDNQTTYVPGTSVPYTMVVRNLGPFGVAGATVDDPLPAGISTANWTCANGANGGVCNTTNGTGGIAGASVNLPVNATVTFTLTMAVPPGQSGDLVNTVTVTGPPNFPDPNPANSTATDTDAAAPRADVQITKLGPAAAAVSANVAYTLTVRNNGPSVARAVSVDDPTPAGVTFVSNAGDCATAFPCALGDLAPAETRTITTTFAIPVGFNSPSLTNAATVSTTTTDPVAGNNTATAVTPIDISADVFVLKTVTPDTGVVVGNQVTFTVTVGNNGPNTATDVVITDVLPAGFAFVSATPSQGTYSDATGAWSIGTIPLGAPPVTLQIAATVTQPGALTNTATRTGQGQPDRNPSNDSSAASINAAPSADVGVTKVVDNPSPSVGTVVAFSMTATNYGPNPATNVVVTDLLPPGLTFQSATPGAGTYDSASGTWTLGNLATSASATLTITATVAASGAIVNTVTRTSQTEFDPNPANDQASVGLNAIPSADLQVTKGASNAAPAVGTDVTFTVTIRNNGPSPATSVVVNDPLPAGLSFVSAVPSQGSYNAGTGEWAVGALDPTQAATLSVTATVDGPAAGALTNTATGTGGEPDPLTDNNTGSTTVNSQVVADLAITKSDGVTTVVPGQPVTYTIVVSNLGPSPVVGAPVGDLFPAPIVGTTWTCAATPPAACTPANGAGSLVATVDLPVGASAVFTATGLLDPATPPGTLTNTASVAAPPGATDPNPANNNGSDTSTIVPTADVQITKSGPPTVTAGTNVTYTLTVTNNGPSVATAVEVNDPAPTGGLTFVSATAPCAAGVTPCALGDLAAAASVSFDVTFAVPPGYTTPDPITNTATVSTTASDPAQGNNTAVAQTALAAPVTDLGVTKTNGVSTVVPGTTTTYTLIVTNAGPSDAVDATVADTFDPAKYDVAGITWSCASTGAASCGLAGSTGNISTTVSIAVDPGGATNFVTFTIQAPVRADATGSLVNTVNVGAGPGQSDPNSTNDTDTDTLTPQADVVITKAGPPTITPGTTVAYTITVANNGPSNAEAVTVSDPTPPGQTFVSNAGACTTAFPCALGVLAPGGAPLTITTTWQVPADYTAPDPLVNTATVTAATPDPNTANNIAAASSAVSVSADVLITKVAPPVIVPGTTASYTLTVVNNGPSVAQNVGVNESTPAGLTLAGVDGPCASFPCTIPSLSVGAPVTFTVRFAVPAGYTGPNPVANTATVTSPTADPDTSNNTSTTSTPLGAGRADLSVEKSGPTTVAPGGTITYTLVVRNAGPSDVTDGVLTDVLPVGVTFDSLTPPATGTCTGGATVSCTGLVVPKGGSASLTITGTVAADLELGAVLTNVVTITSPTTADPAPDNNRDERDSRVGAATDADLAIVKTDAADPVVVGGIVTYTLNVVNYGPATATNVTIDDLLPAGLTLDSVSGACAALPCVVPSLAAGATTTLTVTATATAPGVMTNTATVTASEPDPVPGNNTDIEPTTVAATATDADLLMTKTGPARAGLGETVLYTLTVTNRGPGVAADVQVQDVVPAGLTVTAAAAAQGTCSVSTTVVCAIGTIPAGASVEISVLATATAVGPMTNAATVTTSTPDPDPSNNTSTTTTEVTDPSSSDLAVEKVDSPDAVVAGTPLQYVLTITNRGPGVAVGASVSDPLPAGMTALTVTSTVGTCGTGPTVTCTLGDLPPGAIATVVVTTTAPAVLPSPNPMINTASVTSASADPDPSNNDAAEPTSVVSRANVSVVKSTAQTTVVPGTMVTYTLVVANSGPSAAENVAISDPPPAGLGFVSASAPCAGGFPCIVGTLAPGAALSITVTYQVPSGYTGPSPIVNTAEVTTTTFDGNPADNISTTSTPLAPPQSDLTVVKTGPAIVLRGGEATYLLTVTNAGPSDAPDATLDDPTPAGLTFVSASGPCATGFPCALGPLALGASTTVSVTFQVPPDYAGPQAVTNVATVTSTATDPDPGGNTSTVTTDVIEVADLRVTKTVDNRAPTLNAPVRFTITVFNAGPSDTDNVELVDRMPIGLTLVAATPSQGTFDPATGLWTIGAMANGASATLLIDATTTSTGPLANVATITHTDHLDPDTSNNSAGSAVNVPVASDLQVLKVADRQVVTVGDTVTFTITVRNAGPDDAPAVQIEDTLPAGLTFVAATPSAGTYDPAAGVWTVGALPSGGTATLQLSATVAAADTLVNTARLTGERPYDPDPSNDSSGTTINGVGADLQTVKTVDRTALTVGDRVTFTIVVTNNGPGEATAVVVRESLPPGLVYVSSTASQGTYDPGTGLWTVGTLTPPYDGASRAALTVVADVTFAGVHRNTASIAASDQPDPTPSNDDSSASVEGSGGGTDVEATRVWWLFNPEQDTLDFYVDITNRGDRPTRGPITVMIPLPDGITFHMGPGDWTCEVVGGTNTVACTRADLALQPGEQITLPLWTKGPVPATAAVYGHLTYADDTNPANNVAVLWPCCGGIDRNIDPSRTPIPVVPVVEAARAAAMLPETVPTNTIDLVVTQDAPTVSIAGGVRQLAYTIRITNQGPEAATRLTVTDAIPARAAVVSATATGGICSVGQVGIACQWDVLPVGQTATVAVVLSTPHVGTLTHTVSASAADPEGGLTNNQTLLSTDLSPDQGLDTDLDGLPDVWETAMGLDPAVADAAGDADGDGISNLEEYLLGTHPRGFFRRYFAEGVSNAFFATELAVVNPDPVAPATVVLTAQREGDGYMRSHTRQLGPLSRYQVTGTDVLSGSGSFSTLLESDVPVAADRIVYWDAHHYGSSVESALPEPSTTWYFAEGATHGFALYYLLQNPHPTQTAQVEISYLLPAGGPVVKTYSVAPHSRFTIPVHGIPELAATDVSASVVSTNGVPIVAERAMYRDAAGQVMGAGHASAGATQPGTSWFFAEGATGSFFNLYLLLANPEPTPAVVTARYQLPDGTSFTIPYDVAPQSRRTISVAGEDPRLAATSVAITLTSTSPIVAERAMWWPGPSVSPEWYEAHDSLGATTTGTKWAVAGGSAGGPDGDSTFLLLANQAEVAGTARVTVIFEDGTRAEKTFGLAPTSRLTVDVAAEFPEAVGRTFSALVESLGDTPAPLVVESARYGSPQGVLWGSGGAALATKVQ